MSAWIPLVTGALELAVMQAKALGLRPPGVDELERIKRAVDEKLAEVLPVAIVGVAIGAVAVAAKANAAIDGLGDAPVCRKCGAILRQHIAHSPHSGRSDVTLSCSDSVCGWTSAP